MSQAKNTKIKNALLDHLIKEAEETSIFKLPTEGNIESPSADGATRIQKTHVLLSGSGVSRGSASHAKSSHWEELEKALNLPRYNTEEKGATPAAEEFANEPHMAPDLLDNPHMGEAQPQQLPIVKGSTEIEEAHSAALPIDKILDPKDQEPPALEEPAEEATLVVKKPLKAKTPPTEENHQPAAHQDIKMAYDFFKAPSLTNPESPHADILTHQAIKLTEEKALRLESELEKISLQYETLDTEHQLLVKKNEELTLKLASLQEELENLREQRATEQDLANQALVLKEQELLNYQEKTQQLENKLKNEFRHTRSFERELENRIEILKVEKGAISQAKDAKILELQKKLEEELSENQNLREKIELLQNSLTQKQDQSKRTYRALKLALTNLEVPTPTASPEKKIK